MPELNNDQHEDFPTSFTEEEFEAFSRLFEKGDIEVSIEGEYVVLLALIDESFRHRFARISLSSLVHSVADMMRQTRREEELLALMGLFAKMQMIVSGYLKQNYSDPFIEVINEDEHLEEIDRYRNPEY